MRGALRFLALGVAAPLVACAALAFGASSVAAGAPPANDDFANATNVLSLPLSQTALDTTSATTETNEPVPVGCIGTSTYVPAKTVWYRYTAPGSGPVVADTFGSNFDSAIAIYSGPDILNLTGVGCAYHAGTLGEAVAVHLVMGTTYWLQVGGALGDPHASGLLDVKLSGVPTRLGGPNRFATAAAVSAATFSPGVAVAYIAYAYNFPDALAGAAAAGTIPGPVLLVNGTGPIDSYTAAELTRLQPHVIHVLGGVGLITDEVSDQLVPYATTHVVTRFGGVDRFDTAARISHATFSPGVGVAYIAYAYNFPDALAGAAAAGTIPGPVLLVNGSGPINSYTAAELTRLQPHVIVVLGGVGLISDAVKAALVPFATTHVVTRFGGVDRFDTAARISHATFSPGVGVVYIAYAYNFPDALAGAAAAGTLHGPVLLVNGSGPINSYTAAELTRLQPHVIVVLGGVGLISDAVLAELAAYMTWP